MDELRIRNVIRALKGYDTVEIHDGTHLIDDLSFDSMEVMTLILRLEEELRISFRSEDLELERFVTFGRLLSTLRGYEGDAP